MNKTHYFIFLSVFSILLVLSGCKTTELPVENSDSLIQEEAVIPVKPVDPDHFEDGSRIITAETEFQGRDSLLLCFAGDLMAHTNVTRHGNFDNIFAAIKPFVSQCDFSFANLETPVVNTIEYSNYPNFNVQNEYVEAAIRTGFNVFSLANNHTNDQFFTGIEETRNYFEKKYSDTKDSERPVYAAGIKKTSKGPLTYQIIEKNGWKILFIAATEILNRNDYSSYIDFIRMSETARVDFLAKIKALRDEVNPDLFIVSLHCGEAEYIRTVNATQKKFYDRILAQGVDVLWMNHCHVSKKFELLADQNGTINKAVFYSLGNTISGQRRKANFTNPADDWEYTGEGMLCQLRFEKTENGIEIVQSNPLFVTAYITPKLEFIIKKLDDNFIKELEDQKILNWPEYLKERKKLMEKTKGYTIWQ